MFLFPRVSAFREKKKSMFILRHFQYGISNAEKVPLVRSSFLPFPSQIFMKNCVLGLVCTNMGEPIVDGKEHCSYIPYILVHGSKDNNTTLPPQKKKPKAKIRYTYNQYILGEMESELLTEKVKFEL